MKTIILIPVYNDWESFDLLISELQKTMKGDQVMVLAVDDGSSAPFDTGKHRFSDIFSIHILRLNCNCGHQRAIAVGLDYAIKQSKDDDVIVVMDGDGEDRPSDVPHLIGQLAKDDRISVVFAGRKRRAESLFFRLGYLAYRLLHIFLTGHDVRFGNFSAIRVDSARQLIHQAALWNHYAAAVVHSNIPYSIFPTHRGLRYRGQSSVSTLNLITHGFSALSVYSDLVCIRLLICVLGLLLTGTASLAGIYFFCNYSGR